MGFFVHLLVLSLAVLGVRGQVHFPTATASGIHSHTGIVPPPLTINTGSQGHAINQATASGIHSHTGIVPPHLTINTGSQGHAINQGCDTESNFGIKGVKPTVYMRDIENTIAYALRNQAPYTIDGALLANGQDYKTLTKSQLEALSAFIKALLNHLTLRSTLANFLKCVADKLQKISRCIPGEELEEIYIGCTADGGELPLVQEWVGCQDFVGNASLQQFRSYPCGVWTTFHAMTVNLVQSNQQEVSSLLPTLFGLVLYFPWCDMCRDNFITMYIDTNGECMETAEDVTIWLWRAHNTVTQRVAGQGTNPGRSQLQFPSIAQCLSCCRGCSILNIKECSAFNLPEVYSYLKTIYTPPFP